MNLNELLNEDFHRICAHVHRSFNPSFIYRSAPAGIGGWLVGEPPAYLEEAKKKDAHPG
jgi:hypothetical protein